MKFLRAAVDVLALLGCGGATASSPDFVRLDLVKATQAAEGSSPQELSNVGRTADGRSIDVRITSPNGQAVVALRGSVGQITVDTCESVDLSFAFVDHATGAPVTLSSFDITFLDLGSWGEVAAELLTVGGYQSLYSSNEPLWSKTATLNGRTMFSARSPSLGLNQQIDPRSLTGAQKQRSVAFNFVNSSSFRATWEVLCSPSAPFRGRGLLFAFESDLVPKAPTPNATRADKLVISATISGARAVSGATATSATKSTASTITTDPSTSKSIEKVVALLTELKEAIEKDEKMEQAMYDKYACWCEAFTMKQAMTITKTKAELQTLGNTILTLKGNVATYVAEIEQALRDIDANEMAQKSATVVRQKESAAFGAEILELQQALAALEQAIAILGAATSYVSLRQDAHAETLGAQWKTLLLSIQAAASKLANPAQLAALQAAADHKYTPQSMTIQGILKDMYVTFARDLEGKTSSEAIAHRTFEDYMATKKGELLILQESVKKKQKVKSEAELMLSDATQDYADTEAQLKSHVELFDQTKPACTNKADEWADRKQLRIDELAGVSKALTMLTSDEAKDIFAKTKADGVQSFVQLGEKRGAEGEAQAHALEVLRTSARQVNSLRLASVAADLMEGSRATGAGHFDLVITEIDKIIAELKAEDLEDQKQVDDCKKQYQDIDLAVSDLGWKIAKSEVKITQLDKDITDKGNERLGVINEIGVVQQEIIDMNNTRADENSAFIQQKADDKKAIELLKDAVDYLAEYYENHSMDMSLTNLLQDHVSNVSDEAPDFELSDKGSRKTQAKGIIAILTHLIEDIEGEVEADVKGEETAQLDYEAQVKAAMELEDELAAKKIGIDDTITQLGLDKTAEEGTQSGNEGLQLNQNNTLASIKPGCDWIIENAPERRRKRGIEVDGLTSAKEYLVGFQPTGATNLAQAKSQAGRLRRRPSAAALQVSAVGGERRHQ